MLLTVGVISVITYWLFWAGPARPAIAICGEHCTAARVAEINATWGFDQPVIVQYGHYMGGLINPHGRELGSAGSTVHCAWPCFDRSLFTGIPVWKSMVDAFVPTTWLAAGGAVLWLLGGTLLGVSAALRKGRPADKLIVALALFGASFPTMVFGYLLLLVFVTKLHVLPYPETLNTALFTVGLGPWLKEYLLPWLTIGLLNVALYTRLTRATMIDAMNQDFVQTARAKGLRERRVVYRHCLRVTLPPILTIFGLDLGALLGGAVIVERIYGIQGLGRLATDAVLSNDLSVIMGVTMLSAFFVVFANFVVDVLYASLDPSIRLGRS